MPKIRRNGFAKRVALASRTIPRPKKPWRRLLPIDRWRMKEARAYWRRANEKEKYGKLGEWVLAIRKRLDATQAEFARQIGVTILSVRRWEKGWGYWPTERNIKRLEELDRFSKDMEKQDVKVTKKS